MSSGQNWQFLIDTDLQWSAFTLLLTSSGQQWKCHIATDMTITNFNYKNSYLPGVICNIVVKADLGRSPGRCNTTPKCIMGYILWDRFGSHFGFFKKRWEFPFISE